MKQLRSYINIRKKHSIIKATDKTIKQIVKDELDRLGHDCNLNHIDTSEVTNMHHLFSCDNINLMAKYEDLNPDISDWDVSNVEAMWNMFWGCENFNCDISQWNTVNVKTMWNMFYYCKNFNCNISQWNTANVEDMNSMFRECEIFNQDLSGWDVSNVTDKRDMFLNCPIKEEFKPKFKK